MTQELNNSPSQEETSENATTSLEEKVEQLQKEKDETFARLQRSLADYQNLKKQMEAERMDWVKFANAQLLLSIVSVLDDIERAVGTTPPDIQQSEWYKGFLLVKGNLEKLLHKEGLERIPCEGKPFDPNQHEAILQQPSEEITADHIISEIQAGYTLGGKVIRPAQVIVSKGK